MAMPEGREIERKFLVNELPIDWKRRPSVEIVQGYLPLLNKELQIRLRRKGEASFITIKAGHGRNRLEQEIPISDVQFRVLWPITRGARIRKQRYVVPHESGTIELDVYEGPLRGLVTAEVEFRSEREAKRFRPPMWFGREVTDNGQFSNQTLARRGRWPGQGRRAR
jgi:CYTH domain-containing protein